MANSIKLRTVKTFTFAALALCVSSLASAQQYQADPVDDKAGSLKLTAKECVKNPARFAADRAQFVDFFERYYFPAMTRYAPDDLAQLGRMRDELFSQFLWASRDENLQNELTQMAFKKMQPIERSSKYHPAVRYNAVLILGMLDRSYALDGGAARRPPVPLEEATAELTLVVDYAAQGKAVPPFLLVGALVGLERHAQYHAGLDSKLVEKMTAAVVKLALKDEPLPEVDPKVVEWIRVQAASVLTKLGSPGPNGEVQAVLAKMIAGDTVPKLSLDARCQVAALLSKMKYDGTKIDGKAMADALLKLAVEVADDEAKMAKEFQDTQIGGGFSGGIGDAGSRRRGRVRFDQEEQLLEFDPRILLARFGDLRLGLTAAKPIVPADRQAAFDTVIAAIVPAIDAASAKDALGLEIAEKVHAMAEAIRGAVKPGAAQPDAGNTGDLF